MNKLVVPKLLRLVMVIATVVYGSVVVAQAAANMISPKNANTSASTGNAALSKASVNASAEQVFMFRVGEVVEYDPIGGTITIRDRWGETFEYTLSPFLVVLPAHRADELAVGAYVTVVAPNNVPGGKQLAVRIIIHPGIPPSVPTVPTPVTPTNTPTNTPTDTPTVTVTATDTPTNTPTSTLTNTPTDTPTNTPTDTPTATPTDTPTNTPTNTPTDTPTNTPTDTPTSMPTDTPTSTPTNTVTSTPTNTPTNTPTSTPTPVVPPANIPTAPLIPGPKPDITHPQDLNPPNPLDTIVGFTFPSSVSGWTIPLRAAAFEQIPTPDPNTGFTPVGMVVLGINPLAQQSATASLLNRISWLFSRQTLTASQAQVERVGIVVDYVPGAYIIIADRDGNPYKFSLASPLKIVPGNRADQLKAGAFVTVIAPNNQPGGKEIAEGIVIHPKKPNNFPDHSYVNYVVDIDLGDGSSPVNGTLTSPTTGQIIYDVTFDLLPQKDNPDRTNSPYAEFRNLPVPNTGAGISSNDLCLVVNIGPDGHTRYCSTATTASTLASATPKQTSPFVFSSLNALTSPFAAPALQTTTTDALSVSDSFPAQYGELQTLMTASIAHISYTAPVQLDQVISTIEDPQRLQDCANATASMDATLQETACASDILIAPVTQAEFDLQFNALVAPLSNPTPINVAIVKVLQPITISTGIIEPGDYQVDYWFDTDAVFYAATLTGLTDSDVVVTNQQAPAVPVSFVNTDGTDLPGIQISSCRFFRRCVFFQGNCH